MHILTEGKMADQNDFRFNRGARSEERGNENKRLETEPECVSNCTDWLMSATCVPSAEIKETGAAKIEFKLRFFQTMQKM